MAIYEVIVSAKIKFKIESENEDQAVNKVQDMIEGYEGHEITFGSIVASVKVNDTKPRVKKVHCITEELGDK